MSDPSDNTEHCGTHDKVQKTDAQWRAELTPDQYRITREQGTEPAFTGAYWNTKKIGTYTCRCCGHPLYSSDTKFDSGTGWPSFYKAIADTSVGTETDASHGMVRTEIHCNRCDAHLGHVFEDGPAPTGQRHCVNSTSLQLVEG